MSAWLTNPRHEIDHNDRDAEESRERVVANETRLHLAQAFTTSAKSNGHTTHGTVDDLGFNDGIGELRSTSERSPNCGVIEAIPVPDIFKE
jgi:hypothetical protein